MKRLIITDSSGRILGTVAYPVQPAAGGDGPTSIAIVPLKDQRIHVVDIPEQLGSHEGLSRLHREYKVVGEGEHARLELSSGTT